MKLIQYQVDQIETEIRAKELKKQNLNEQKVEGHSIATSNEVSGDINYDAKTEVQILQNEINSLWNLLRTSEIVPTAATEDIQIGSKFSVEVTFDDDDVEQFVGTLVEDIVITGMEDGKIVLYTAKSPLGQAILGKKAGDTISWGENHGIVLDVPLEKVPQFRKER